MSNAQTHGGKQLSQSKEQQRRVEIQQRTMARRGFSASKEKARSERSALARWIDNVN